MKHLPLTYFENSENINENVVEESFETQVRQTG